MKPGLSLRVSQHLALTPQLQQSIRLLQLSTLELSQEVEQMLDDNPFLELASDDAPREEFGIERADTPVQDDVYAVNDSHNSIAESAGESSAEGPEDTEISAADSDVPQDWEGDGSVEVSALDDAEWGSEAPVRGNRHDDEDAPTALDLAGAHESLTDFLHQQALSLRLSEIDRYPLRFLI